MYAFSYADFLIPQRRHSRYPLEKFALIRQRVIEEGVLPAAHVLVPPRVSEDTLLLGHAYGYVKGVRHGTLSEMALREMGFVWCPALYERGSRIVGSAIETCRYALREGVSVTLGGGAHHAYPHKGKGFCIFNDIVLAARVMQQEGLARRVAVLDCDVHQGDGTAAMTRGDDSIFTVSVHCERNFPFHKEASDLDIGLPEGSGDGAYLRAVKKGLAAIIAQRPQLVIFVAGADNHEEDRLGKLLISSTGLGVRDRLVCATLLAEQIPVAILFGGGYCDPLEATVAANVATVRLSLQVLSEAVF